MIYIASDIHGEYDLFMRLLERIRFTEQDEMIVCGDAIDKGTGSVRLLTLLSAYRNFKFILGNHEYDFLKSYRALMQNEQSDYDNVLKTLQENLGGDGGRLTWDIVDWLDAQPFYLERDRFLCVHSGVPIDRKDNTIKNLNAVTAEQFVYDRGFKDPNVLPNTDRCIFYGHTPSNYLTGKHEFIAYAKTEEPKSISDFIKIQLDIGSWLGGGVGCFCVDNLQEYYIRPDGAFERKNNRI